MRFRNVDKLTDKKDYPSHAHWIEDGKLLVLMKYSCSACGNRSVYKDNYCSYCGAKMDEEEEDA